MSESRPTRATAYAMLAGASVLWGCWTLFFRTAERMQSISPAAESFTVFAVTLVVLGPWAWRDGRGRKRSAGLWALMALLGLADAGNVLCYFGALQKTSVAIAVITHYLTPVLIAIAEPVVLRTRPERSPWPSALLAIAGIVLVCEP
jgi:drug/metabolite transporter (DMT)-like permease